MVAVEVVELDSALEAGANFVGVVLEAFEGPHLALVDDFAAAAQTGGSVAVDFALCDEAARHKPLGERKHLANFRRAGLRFFEIGVEQVGHHLPDLIAHLVNNLVGLDPHAVVLRQRRHAIFKFGVESNDHRARGTGH